MELRPIMITSQTDSVSFSDHLELFHFAARNLASSPAKYNIVIGSPFIRYSISFNLYFKYEYISYASTRIRSHFRVYFLIIGDDVHYIGLNFLKRCTPLCVTWVVHSSTE